MKINTPKGIIFDCDGTLADTMPLHWRAWQAITRRHKLHFPVDRFYELGGVFTKTPTLACKPSAPREWKRWMCGNC